MHLVRHTIHVVNIKWFRRHFILVDIHLYYNTVRQLSPFISALIFISLFVIDQTRNPLYHVYNDEF